MKRKAIRVGKGKYVGATSAVLQKAVDDAAAAGGGTVEIPAGTFEMVDALHLRSGVRVVGQGAQTVLRKRPSVSSAIADYLGYGHYEITLEQPDLFEPGMGVLVLDNNAMGFYTTTATLLEREGNAFFIDKMLNHDYDPDQGGRVVSIFPLVAGQWVEDVAVLNLTLDGAGDPERMNGCRGAGVFLLQAHTATVEGVEVVNYNGDAVSFQQCTDVVVRGCRLHHNTGGGIHPGSGSVRYLIAGNHAHDNGGDGIFYCLRTTHSLCEGNRIEGNTGVGISLGERDTDHLIRGNDISGNGGPGVLFRPIHRNGADGIVLEGNRLAGNCRCEGSAEIAVAPGIRDVVLRGNNFAHLKGKAVEVGNGARGICLPGNTVEGRACAREDVAGARECASFSEPASPPCVGPAAACSELTRHLGVELSGRPANFELEGR